MTITKITVFCDNDSMGDNVTAADANGYRTWLADQLTAEYPGAAIEVSDEQAIGGARVETDAGDDLTAEDSVNHFLDNCWERCGWEWVPA